jgi:hypothetical protein
MRPLEEGSDRVLVERRRELERQIPRQRAALARLDGHFGSPRLIEEKMPQLVSDGVQLSQFARVDVDDEEEPLRRGDAERTDP